MTTVIQEKPGSSLHIVPGSLVQNILSQRPTDVFDIIEDTYLSHAAGASVNPDSYFLRFPDRPSDRIIALPARLRKDGRDRASLKWISSFPGNVADALPRASSVIVLNDMHTGFPVAVLEGSHISATRTAASAALAARHMHTNERFGSLFIVGAGPIGQAIFDHLISDHWQFTSVQLCDTDANRAEAAVAALRANGHNAVVGDIGDVSNADLVVFATTAASPHLSDPSLFSERHTVLHISLRDLDIPIVLAAQNIVDDVEHCMKAQTSLHLAEQQTGDRSFVSGTIADLLSGEVTPDRDRPRIFSPFGLGVLDLALADFVHTVATTSDSPALIAIEDFFGVQP